MSYLLDPANWQWLITGNDLRFILEGFLVNLEIAAIAMVFSLILGLALALARVSKLRLLSVPAGLWIDLWRNLPLIFMILYFALAMPRPWREAYESIVPGFFPEALQSGRVLAALAALVLYNSAVLAEIMRSGILSLERGQGEAAASLGLTNLQAMRLVILPQGLRRMVPATVSQLDHPEQGHDPREHHRHPGGDAARPDSHELQLLRRGPGTGAAGVHLHRPALHRGESAALAPVAPARAARTRPDRHDPETREWPGGSSGGRERCEAGLLSGGSRAPSAWP